MHSVSPIYSTAVSLYFTPLNILRVILLISMIVVDQNGFVLDAIIHICEIVIVANAINGDSMYKFRQNNHIYYKLNKSRIIVYRLNTNVIFVYIITRYDEFGANPYKIDVFHSIHNKIHYFDVIIRKINVKNSVIYLIELLGVGIKSLVTYFHLCTYISVDANVLMIING